MKPFLARGDVNAVDRFQEQEKEQRLLQSFALANYMTNGYYVISSKCNGFTDFLVCDNFYIGKLKTFTEMSAYLPEKTVITYGVRISEYLI